MSTHTTRVHWTRTSEDFHYDRYNRDHDWHFGTGATLAASAAEDFKGNPTRVNPEEALVAALSSCHMLTFLAVAARKGFVVEQYDDEAVGYLEKNSDGRLAVTRTALRPKVVFSGEHIPDAAQLVHLHESAHRGCFIASSVRTEVTIEPR